MSDSVACYFQHLSPSVFTAFSCRLYFCGLRSNTQETFLPVFPDENMCLSAATFHRCSSFYPHLTQRGGVKHSTMVLWGYYLYCLILQILWFNCLSICISAIDLCFFFVGIESRQKLDRQRRIKVNN